MAAPRRHYPRPPIVESVIDLKFDGILPDKERERLRDRFKSDFPSIEERTNVTLAVGPQGISTTTVPAGFKLTAKNAVDVVLINQDSFGTVRLGPYDRWESLLASAKANFETFTKVLGRKRVVRLGVRFINRVDIPKARMTGRSLDHFFKFGVALPAELARERGSFTIVSNFVEASTGAKIILNSGEILPALLDHVSFNLDIDAYWDDEISLRIEEMWERAELLRDAKNACFESCITDALRALFQ
jgi:uncharacterized protein (TIGR04255 family)